MPGLASSCRSARVSSTVKMIARAQISASMLPGSGASIRRISSVAGFSPVTPSSTRSTVLHSQQKRFMPKICPNTPGRKHIDGLAFGKSHIPTPLPRCALLCSTRRLWGVLLRCGCNKGSYEARALVWPGKQLRNSESPCHPTAQRTTLALVSRPDQQFPAMP
jgi:hypothetical protein